MTHRFFASLILLFGIIGLGCGKKADDGSPPDKGGPPAPKADAETKYDETVSIARLQYNANRTDFLLKPDTGIQAHREPASMGLVYFFLKPGELKDGGWPYPKCEMGSEITDSKNDVWVLVNMFESTNPKVGHKAVVRKK